MNPKDAARKYLIAAENYLKDSMFDDARREITRAQETDPSNEYTFAFLERIDFFSREQNSKTARVKMKREEIRLIDDEGSRSDHLRYIGTTPEVKPEQMTDKNEKFSFNLSDIVVDHIEPADDQCREISLTDNDIKKLEPEETENDLTEFSDNSGNIGNEQTGIVTRIEELEKRIDSLVTLVENSDSDTDQNTNAEKIKALEQLVQILSDEMQSLDGSIRKKGQIDEKPDSLISDRLDYLENCFNSLQKDSGENRVVLENGINDLRTGLDKLSREVGEDRKSRIDFEDIDSRFTDLDNRIEQTEDLLAKILRDMDSQKAERKKNKDVHNSIDIIYQQIEEILETLHFEKELRQMYGELDQKLSQLSGKVDSLAKSSGASGRDEGSIEYIDKNIQTLHERFENEQEDYKTRLQVLSDTLTELEKKLESDHHSRELSAKRQLEYGLNLLRTAAMKAWENGVPAEEDSAELKNLCDLFSISEETEKKLMHEVKMESYGRAVKRSITEQKSSKADKISLDIIRRQFGVSIDEYMDYESKFLDDLVSSQFNGTLLIVSADDDIRSDLGERLKSVGFTVISTHSPDNALEKLEIINPQVILSDIGFPAGSHNGLNLLNILRRNIKFSYIPFILTGHDDELDETKRSLTRPNECAVRKPVDFYSLLNTINKQLNRLRDHLSSQSL